MKQNITAYTLIEILVWILIVSTIMIAWFQASSMVWVAKIKLSEKTDIEREAFFAWEKLFEKIKAWGTIDYEEYWNRSMIGRAYASGHYIEPSGFWNYWLWGIKQSDSYWEGFYYCMSENGISMGSNGCMTSSGSSNPFTVTSTGATLQTFFTNDQRYGQYEFQFIDHNGDQDNCGDEWGVGYTPVEWWGCANGSILNDYDDMYLWMGPEVFSHDSHIGELYLISSDGTERTYFRWHVKKDPVALAAWIDDCDFSTPSAPMGESCFWTIEMLKLVWKDYGLDHVASPAGTDSYENDGIIDTWVLHPDFMLSSTEIVAGSDANSYWQPIFNDEIHVKEFIVKWFPHKDAEHSWRDVSQNLEIAPYVKISLVIAPSWKNLTRIKWTPPDVQIATTVALSNVDFYD